MYEMSLRFEGILWLWNEVSFKGRCTAQQEQKVKQMTEVARVSDNPTFLLILQHSQGPIVAHPLHLNLPSLPWPGLYRHSLYKRTQEPTWVIKCTPVFLLAICLRLCTCSVLTQSKKAFPPCLLWRLPTGMSITACLLGHLEGVRGILRGYEQTWAYCEHWGWTGWAAQGGCVLAWVVRLYV